MVDLDETSATVEQIGTDAWRFDDAVVRVRYAAPSVLVYKFSGKMRSELVPQIRQAADAVLRTSREISLFFDTEDMAGYHPEFRSRMTAWHEELRDRTAMAGVLVRSSVIRMAISVASLVTRGKLESFSDRASFDRAIDAAVRGSRMNSASRAS